STNFFGKPTTSVKAGDEVNLTVEKGETLGIVGESGCGKSTLGNTIIRLLEPTEGSVYFEGEDIYKLSPKRLQRVRKDLQMIFQDPFSSLNTRMRVFDIIDEPLRKHKVAKGQELKNMVYALIDMVG